MLAKDPRLPQLKVSQTSNVSSSLKKAANGLSAPMAQTFQRFWKLTGVDTSRTTTNNIHEIAKTLGVEASRNALVHEAKGVLEDQGLDVDVRHVMLVADMMTTTGEVQQIGRHGISGKKASVLRAPHSKSPFPTLLKQPLKVKVILWLE